MIKVWKALIDTVGHYARPDIVRLEYLKNGSNSLALAVEAFESATPAQVNEIADRHEVTRTSLDSAVQRVAQNRP